MEKTQKTRPRLHFPFQYGATDPTPERVAEFSAKSEAEWKRRMEDGLGFTWGPNPAPVLRRQRVCFCSDLT